ncbi:MAG: TolC family protein [Bacteroidales bacterium]|nr:TolC family protein [Bacteroidales bacterium]
MKKAFITLVFMALGLSAAHAISIVECFRLAKENYPMIKQYNLTEQLSDYSFKNASLVTWVPQLTLSGQFTYQDKTVAFPDEIMGLFSQYGVSFKGMSKDQYKVQLQLNQMIWDGGYAKAQREAIRAEEDVSLLQVNAQVDAILEQVSSMYFGILTLEANLRTNIYADELMSENLKVAESAVENGAAMQSDADVIKVEILSLRQQRRQLELSILTYRSMLAIMIGREITMDEEFVKPSPIIIDTKQSNRTELKVFDAQLRSLDASKKLLNSAITPRFNFFAQGWYGKPGNNMFDDMVYGKLSWNGIIGVSMTWNLTGFYTRKNDKRSLEVQRQVIEVQRETFNYQISLQQEQIQSEIDRMNEIGESDDEILALRKSIRAASESKFRNGVITSSDLLRDITNENNAVISKDLHEFELLKNIYEMGITFNQVGNE